MIVIANSSTLLYLTIQACRVTVSKKTRLDKSSNKFWGKLPYSIARLNRSIYITSYTTAMPMMSQAQNKLSQNYGRGSLSVLPRISHEMSPFDLHLHEYAANTHVGEFVGTAVVRDATTWLQRLQHHSCPDSPPFTRRLTRMLCPSLRTLRPSPFQRAGCSADWRRPT